MMAKIPDDMVQDVIASERRDAAAKALERFARALKPEEISDRKIRAATLGYQRAAFAAAECCRKGVVPV